MDSTASNQGRRTGHILNLRAIRLIICWALAKSIGQLGSKCTWAPL
ncbi:hypothetical protein HanPSC8_Chr13g0557771 [Helianthus annuus]|nr:hypothetical protein HanPSC8_Chr13g0557771 [Helianthus annuus]